VVAHEMPRGEGGPQDPTLVLGLHGLCHCHACARDLIEYADRSRRTRFSFAQVRAANI
jgi:hypothetical protein